MKKLNAFLYDFGIPMGVSESLVWLAISIICLGSFTYLYIVGFATIFTDPNGNGILAVVIATTIGVGFGFLAAHVDRKIAENREGRARRRQFTRPY